MKFQIGQEVIIISGAMTGRKAKILSHKPSQVLPVMNWYELTINDKFDSIFYSEYELESVQ